MSKHEIIKAVKTNGSAEIAVLQQRFGLTYTEVKNVIDDLVANGILVYESGLRYTYVKKTADSSGKRKAGHSTKNKDEKKNLPDEEELRARRREYLEMRRRELIKKMQADLYPADESEEDDSDAGDSVADKKEMPESAQAMPSHPSWDDKSVFEDAVMTRIERLAGSDKFMEKRDAEKKAEAWLEAVKDTCDTKMAEVYERVVYEIRIATVSEYEQLKKQLFGE